MRICFLSAGYRSVKVLNGDSSDSGGAEAQTAYLAAALASIGHQVTLIYGDGRASSASDFIAGVRCLDVFSAWKHPGSLLAFWTALKKSAADLIYANLPSDFMWLPGLYSKLHPRSRFVYAISSDKLCNPWHTYAYNSWFHNPLYALGMRSADFINLQHEEQAQWVRPYVKGELARIPNLVRSVARAVRNYEETDMDAIWIALIRPVKQLQVLLDIAEKLPDIRFAVVGGFDTAPGDTVRDDLEDRMRAQKNVRYWGPQRLEEVIRLLARSKILVNTSKWEGLPNTMLEAWSVGTPVVSLTVDPGGIIQQETLGLVSGNVTKMLDDIKLLVQTRSLNHEMGEKGLAYVRKRHSLEAVCRAFEQIAPGFQIQDGAKQEAVA